MAAESPLGRLLVQAGNVRTAVASTLAANSMVFRLLPDALASGLARAAELVVDSLLGTLLAVTVTVRLADVRLLGVGFELLLYGYVAYEFLPRLLPQENPAGAVFARLRVRVAGAVAVLAVGTPLYMTLPVMFSASPLAIVRTGTPLPLPANLSPVTIVATMVVTALAVWALTVAYTYLAFWRGADLDDRLNFFEQMVPHRLDERERAENREQLARQDWAGTVTSATGVIAAAGVPAVTLFFLGLLSGMAVMLFPLPEAVVLAGAVGQALPESERLRLPGWLAARRLDVEQRLYTVMRYVRTSRKGMLLVPYMVTGFVISILLAVLAQTGLVMFLLALASNPGGVLRLALRLPVAAWALVGVFVCISGPGLYGLWFWVRQTFRLPHYLDHWESSHPGGAPIDVMEDLPENLTRPPGHLLVPSVLLVPVGWLLLATGPGSYSSSELWTFAVAWPLAAAVVAAAVGWTYRAPPQPSHTDGQAIFGAYLVQLGWTWLLVGGAMVPGFDGPFGVVELVVIVGVSTLLYVYPDLEVYLTYVAGGDATPGVGYAGGLDTYVAAVGGLVAGVVALALGAVVYLLDPTRTVLVGALLGGGCLFVGLGAVAGVLQRLASR